MYIPSSTYRIQFNKDFTFRHLDEILDYLSSLGISTIYASPIFMAVPGSMHGYDVIDPCRINPEIGTMQELKTLARKLKSKKMSWVQDIVPNHMAFHTGNERLMDVLERGPYSPYYNFFDIQWKHHNESLNGRLQAPVLGKPLKECARDEDIKIAFSAKGFTVSYFDNFYPLSISAYRKLCEKDEANTGWVKDFVELGESLSDLNDWSNDKESFLATYYNDNVLLEHIDRLLQHVNSDKDFLISLLENQYYKLCFWQDTEKEINYRRFFTVNELICLKMESERVFKEHHQFLHQLYKEGLIQGLRVDHIDGLKDPLTYIKRLRNLFGPDCYIIAEKILESSEDIPEQWPLEGTSGYEFLAFTSQLITNRKGAKELLEFYRSLVPLPPYHEIVLANKRLILERYMVGEWDNLVELAFAMNLSNGFSRENIRAALSAFMISLPVYRIYPAALPIRGHDRKILAETFSKALQLAPEQTDALEHIQGLWLHDNVDLSIKENAFNFLQRCMQFTGPLTAKGVEDTTFYMYNALISHDEVGDSPSVLGISINAFHAKMKERQKRTPLSLNATSTHDTKRGEDGRLRLNALCKWPEEWQTLATEWIESNKAYRSSVGDGKIAPRLNDEYYIYQSIIGGFPEDGQVTAEFIDRLIAFETKALREAKRNSDWTSPDEKYEHASHEFIRKILSDESRFRKSLQTFLEKIIDQGNHYAIAQVLIKSTAPGIPDIYQGCELWDLSFVDPDNRRPVDYALRNDMLDKLAAQETEGFEGLLTFLHENEKQGAMKLFVTWKTLLFRRRYPDVFWNGSYEPLFVEGTSLSILAFARVTPERTVIVIVPISRITPQEVTELERATIAFASEQPLRNMFTNAQVHAKENLPLLQALDRFPVALLVTEDPK